MDGGEGQQGAVVVQVLEADGEEPLVRGGQEAVVHRAAQRAQFVTVGLQPIRSVVEGQAQTVALGGAGQHQRPHRLGQSQRVALLQAQRVHVVSGGELGELHRRATLVEVVADRPQCTALGDSHPSNLPPG